MQHKHSLLLVLILTAFISETMAQDKFSKVYIKIYGGHSLLTPGSKAISYSSTSTTTTVNTSKKGNGNGIRIGLGMGLIVSDFINVGIDGEHFYGSKLQASIVTPAKSVSVTSQYNTTSLTPYAMFKALSKPNYLVYNKLGILVNLPFNMNFQTDYKPVLSGTFQTIDKVNVPTEIGLNVAIGGQINLTHKLRGIIEAFGNFLVVNPYSLERVSLNKDGTVIGPIHYTYVKNGVISPDQITSSPIQINAIGINLGVTYRL